MVKEVLLYGGIYSWSVEKFIKEVNGLQDTDELVLRINTMGGSPEDMIGMIAKYQEFKGAKRIKVDGRAYSAGAFFLLYENAKNIEATDQSKIMIHRAAYDSYLESNKDFMTPERTKVLEDINLKARKALELKISNEDFVKVTGVSYDELFSMEKRVDVFLSAEQAKKLGLISKINNLTQEEENKMKADYVEIMAINDDFFVYQEQNNKIVNPNKQINKKMRADEIKSSNIDGYNEILAIGASQELDRVNSWMVFADVDSKRVKEGIASGKSLSQTDIAELTLKAVSSKELKAMEEQSTKVVTTNVVINQEEDRASAISAFESELYAKIK